MRVLRILLLVVLVLETHGLSASDGTPVLFERDVRPILKVHCWQCHGEEAKPEAGLDLRLARWMLKGGEAGPAVVAGKLAESLIWKRIAAGEMPPKGKGLSDKEKATLSAWIEQGAKTARPEPESLQAGADWTEEERGSFAAYLADHPDAGDVVPGSGGLRKVRWKRAGSGKSGGVRVIYFTRLTEREIVLLTLYAKAKLDNLTGSQLKEIRRALEE